MKKSGIILILAALLALSSCNEEGGSSIPHLLHTVPSDAVMVVTSSRVDKGLRTMLDSTNVLYSFDYGSLSNAEMVLSYVFTGSSQPVLTIDGGLQKAEATELLAKRAEHNGLYSKILSPGVITLTTNSVVLASVERHIASETSILDAPGFTEALESIPSPGNAVFVRNSTIDKILPREFLSGTENRRRMTSFLQRASEWTMLTPIDRGFKLSCSHDGAASHYCSLLEKLEPQESHLAEILPLDASYVLAITVCNGFREEYENYLDAASLLGKYKNWLRSLKKLSDKDPLAWEKTLGIREVARVKWQDREVLLLRPTHLPEQQGLGKYEATGFAAVLYGGGFALADESCCTTAGAWIVVGSPENVKAFAECGRHHTEDSWPYRNCSFVVHTTDFTLYRGLKEMKLYVNP